MKNLLLTTAAALALSTPLLAQPGPGIGGVPQATPAAPAAQPGPGFGSATQSAAPPAAAPAAPAGSSAVASAPTGPAKAAGKSVYDEGADAKAVVAEAVGRAGREGKRVLVTLGANWCGWCRALDRTFTRNPQVAAEIEKSYVPVKVDVGRMTKNLDLAATWGADPKKGVPLLVVLDGKGKAVKVQETGSLEVGKGHDPDKVLAFLKENAGI